MVRSLSTVCHFECGHTLNFSDSKKVSVIYGLYYGCENGASHEQKQCILLSEFNRETKGGGIQNLYYIQAECYQDKYGKNTLLMFNHFNQCQFDLSNLWGKTVWALI